MTTIARAAAPRTRAGRGGFALGGRGVWVWEAGAQDPGRLAARLRRHRFHWLAVKAADGTSRFNSDAQLRAYAEAAEREGLGFGLWAYLVGEDPVREAQLCADLVERYDADFFLADAEIEYERAQGPVSRGFARAFRSRLPQLPAALSSFGRVDLHPGLDWHAWREAGFDFHPQAYTCESTALSPRACVEHAAAIWPRDRIRPTLGAYRGAAGRPSGAALADSVRDLGATGFDLWRVGTLRDADLAALRAVPIGIAGRRRPAGRVPYRPLIPATPMLEGGDVRVLQVAINKRRRARRLGTLLVDGEYGQETHKAAFETAWLLGIGSRRTPTGAFPVSSQKLVRNPRGRSGTQVARALERRRTGEYSALTQAEREWWNVLGRLREVRDNLGGLTPDQAARLEEARAWLERRRAEIERAAENEGWDENDRSARFGQLAPGNLDRAGCRVLCELPTGNSTRTEQKYLAERKVWWRVDTTGQDRLQKLKAQNYDWLCERRRQVWRLAEGTVSGEAPGWDRADRRQRYDNLCIATRHGSAYRKWRETHDPFTGEPTAETGRDVAVRNARAALGTRERPSGSNRGMPQPSGWQRRVFGSDGVPWCACFTTCMAWDTGVTGAGSAGVAVCVDLARRGKGIYRGWTTDPSEVKRGDHAVIGSVTSHIGMVVDDADACHTIEGNTSGSHNGSQFNGDGVYERRRRRSEVVGWCLVRF